MAKIMTPIHDPFYAHKPSSVGIIDAMRSHLLPSSESVIRSTRLTSPAAHTVFILVGLVDGIGIILNWFNDPLVRWIVLPLMPIYLGCGTLVWHWTQRHGRWQRTYFVIMAVIGSAILLAASYAVDGMAGLLIVIPLVVQAAVLPRKQRHMLLGTLIAVTALSAITTGTSFSLNSILTLLSALSGILTFDFLGGVIVGEEAARRQVARYAREVEELSIMRERTRLAREIHDNLGHYLTAIHMQAQAAQAVLSIQPQQADEALTHIRTLATDGLREVRQSIANARARPLENRTLHEALIELIADSRSGATVIDFAVIGRPLPAPAEVDMTLYRVVQETLTNIHKHARARHATVRLRYQPSPPMVALRVQDDGIGADKTDGGFGLLGLRERVYLLGGSLRTETAPGRGFAVEVEIAL